MTDSAKPTVHIDNERTRVTQWHFDKRGDSTGWHRHEFDYVIVPLADGTLQIEGPDGTTSHAELTSGVPYYRDAGVEHDVISANDFPFAFIEIEIKQ